MILRSDKKEEHVMQSITDVVISSMTLGTRKGKDALVLLLKIENSVVLLRRNACR